MKQTVRRILSLVLCAALLCLLLSACGQPSGPLRVLVDVDNAPGVAGKNSAAECAEQLAARIRSVCGREDVQVETLPALTPSRSPKPTRSWSMTGTARCWRPRPTVLGGCRWGRTRGAVFQITGGNEAVPLEMVPLYNTTGGVTATVFSFAAINAHTKQPDDAFLVLDDLLSRQGQKTSLLFRRLGESGGILLYDGLGSPGDPVQDAEGSSWAWSAEDDEEFREVVDCITQVHLYGTLEMELNTLARGFYSLRQGNPYWPYRDLKAWTHEVYSRMEQELGE